ncbi:MAG: hypothetical protein Q7J04_02050, partial [Microcella sp.]|nr:hypothetical protein [Microcella sp.]
MSAARERGGRRAPRRRAPALALVFLTALAMGAIPTPTSADATVTDGARVEVLAAPSASGAVF